MKERKTEIGSLVVFFYLVSPALSQNVQIQAVPPTVKYLEDDLVIICSITNSSNFSAVLSLELQRNESGSFQTIVSIGQDQAPQWANTLLKRRANVSISVSDTYSAEMKFSVDKENVLCPEDFTMYKCKNDWLHDEDQITITYTNYSMVYPKSLSVLFCGTAFRCQTHRFFSFWMPVHSIQYHHLYHNQRR